MNPPFDPTRSLVNKKGGTESGSGIAMTAPIDANSPSNAQTNETYKIQESSIPGKNMDVEQHDGSTKKLGDRPTITGAGTKRPATWTDPVLIQKSPNVPPAFLKVKMDVSSYDKLGARLSHAFQEMGIRADFVNEPFASASLVTPEEVNLYLAVWKSQSGDKVIVEVHHRHGDTKLFNLYGKHTLKAAKGEFDASVFCENKRMTEQHEIKDDEWETPHLITPPSIFAVQPASAFVRLNDCSLQELIVRLRSCFQQAGFHATFMDDLVSARLLTRTGEALQVSLYRHSDAEVSVVVKYRRNSTTSRNYANMILNAVSSGASFSLNNDMERILAGHANEKEFRNEMLTKSPEECLQRVRHLLLQDCNDVNILGMEGLCLLADPNRRQSASLLASRAILVGKDDSIQEFVIGILSKRSTGQCEESLAVLLSLVLEALNHALMVATTHVIVEGTSDVVKHFLEKADGQLTETNTLDLLQSMVQAARSEPHNAFLAAKCRAMILVALSQSVGSSGDLLVGPR